MTYTSHRQAALRPVSSLGALLAAILLFAPALRAQTSAPAAAPASDKVVELDPFLVQSSGFNGYTATRSSSGTRIATDIKETPFTVDVVPLEIWDDFAVLTFNQQETLASVPGVSATENNGTYNLRGITSGTYFLRDGFLRFGRVDQSNVERIEVLKGPAAAIYGKTLPGGIINVISKLAKSKPEYSLEVQSGGLDLYRTALSATGPLIPGKLLYRFDTAASQEKAFEEQRVNRIKSISGQLMWQINSNTRATLLYDYVDEYRGGRDLLDEAVVKAGAVFKGLGWDLPNYRHDLNTSGGATYSTFVNKELNFSLVSKLSEIFTLRLAANWHGFSLETLRGTGSWDPTTNLVWNRRPDFGLEDRNGHAINLDLLSQFKLAGMQHHLLTTFDFVRDQRELGPTWRLDPLLYRTATGYPGTQLLKEYDASGLDPNPYPPIGDFNALFRDQNSINTTLGFLVNDRITIIPDRLTASLGGRHDKVHQIGEDLFAHTRSDTNVSATTVQSGLTYNLTQDLSLYSSYSTSFSPQTVLDPAGNPFPNQEGKGYDVGVKMDIMQKQLFVTATYFDIVYDNIVQQGLDPVTNATIFTLTGSTKSKGGELSIGGRLWNALTTKFALSYTDAATSGALGANAVLNGLPPRSVPAWTYSTLLKYDFNAGRLKGAFVGMNVIANSDFRYSDSTVQGRYRVRVPGWIRYDFNTGYRWKTRNTRWSHSVSVVLKNAFDREYAYGTSPTQGNPRQWVVRYSLLFR
jgi:iron complex outermembrane receptor protein